MSLPYSVAALVLSVVVALWAWHKDKTYEPGNPPLISHSYILLTALIVSIVLMAGIFSDLTGITWDPPFMR